MRLIPIHHVESGMLLGKPIFSGDGRILLKELVPLSDSYIRRLRKLGYTSIYIEDAETSDIIVEETIPDEIRQEVVVRIKKSYDHLSSPKTMERMLNSGQIGQEFSKLYNLLFDHLKVNDTFMLNMSSIYASDMYLYAHCMNVGVFSSVIGMAHGLSEERVKQLGVGAMLHDVGKLGVDKSILDKPGALTEEERIEVEKHTWYGYNILIKQAELSPLTAHCALQHHEKIDGSGYPRKLKGNDIHDFGRILAVADVYDALTSNRPYRKQPALPHEAMEYLYAGSGTHFDPHFVRLFREYVNIYPIGMQVQLSNGTFGIVAAVTKGTLDRPTIRVVAEQGYRVIPYDIDLSKHNNIVISSVRSLQETLLFGT